MFQFGSAAATMTRVLLVQMPSEQTAAYAAGNRPKCSAAQGIAYQRTAYTTRDCTDGAVAAATAMAIVAAMTTIVMTVSLHRCGDHHREASHHDRSCYHQFTAHTISLNRDLSGSTTVG